MVSFPKVAHPLRRDVFITNTKTFLFSLEENRENHHEDMAGANDAAAIRLLTRAVELDGRKQKSKALALYKEAIDLLLQAVNGMKEGDPRVAAFRAKAAEALKRAEILDSQVEADKRAGSFHEQVRFNAGFIFEHYVLEIQYRY